MSTYSFVVYGKPEPAGSKKGFPIKRPGGATGVAIVDANPKAKGWQRAVSEEARQTVLPALAGLLTGALAVTMRFYVQRPQGHYGSGKNAGVVKRSSPARPTTKPDVLKLARGVEDACTSVIWGDDAQIVSETLEKHYGARPRVEVEIVELEQANERVSA